MDLTPIFVGLLALFVCTNANGHSVVTNLGTINGDSKTVTFRGKSYTVDRYFGIPYAKPPTGDLRFKKPEPREAFSEPFNAVNVPPSCPQVDYPFLKQSGGVISEDCLFLNIYVPQQEPDSHTGHAVMFFIHGGGFTTGGSFLYRSEVLASVGNVIIVVINYRLGLLGFMNIGDERARGNFGLWDQRLALQWVNQNIQAFGGDKDRVTIFGESAGSMSVTFQMLYPANKGLFRSAIAESGTLTMPTLVKDDGIEIAKYFAVNMSCSTETIDEVFNCLMTANAEKIIKVIEDTTNAGMSAAMKVGAGPTIDGEFIRMKPSELITRSKTESLPEVEFMRSIKLINGMNGAEGAMFLLFHGDKLEEFELTREAMKTLQVPAIAGMEFGYMTAVPEAVKKMIEYEYTDWTNPDDPKALRLQMVKAYGDISFAVPGIELSRLHANGSNVGSYLYNFVSNLDMHPLPTPKWVEKANHGDELDPVFGYNFDYETFRNISGYIPPEWELDLSSRMMAYWSNFAKSGDPNVPVKSSPSTLVWPEYNLDTNQHLVFDKEDSIGQYLYAREYAFWRNTLPAVYNELTHAQTLTAQFAKDAEGTCDKDGTCG